MPSVLSLPLLVIGFLFVMMILYFVPLNLYITAIFSNVKVGIIDLIAMRLRRVIPGTAYEILSIDIADIDVGKNIGAELQIDQANADKSIAQAKAEERRAMAIAEEQEMIAKAQEARASVIAAESRIPEAMAEAFRNGNMGIMDYYKLKNIEADTKMRDGISDSPTT